MSQNIKVLRHWLVGWFMLFNVTFKNISDISWQLVSLLPILVEETGVLGENDRHVANH